MKAANHEERLAEENDDAMTALENRTRDTQKMVDALDALDELKAMSQRNERLNSSSRLSILGDKEKPLGDEDEALLKSFQLERKKATMYGPISGEIDSLNGENVRSDFIIPELEASVSSVGKRRNRAGAASTRNPVSCEAARSFLEDEGSMAPISDDPDFTNANQPLRSVGISGVSLTALDAGELGESRQTRKFELNNSADIIPVLKMKKRKAKARTPSPLESIAATSCHSEVEKLGLVNYDSSGDE